MIVRDIMTTKLITIEPDDTLSHAANLLRQHQFHHLPVARTLKLPEEVHTDYTAHHSVKVLEGVLTAQDIDLAVAVAKLGPTDDTKGRPWQERFVSEVMHRAAMRVTPTTSLAAVAKLLAERGLNYLPVVEYKQVAQETKVLLVGLLTRSDLLLALARSMGAFEPGMQLDIVLPMGDMTPLATTLRLASELHMPIRSVIAAPLAESVPTVANLRLGTINPMALLLKLKEANIEYAFAEPLIGGTNV